MPLPADQPHPAGQHLSMPEGRVYFETEGEGPFVLLVPGGPGAGHAHYHPWFSALADQHTVVYLDQLGTGRSDRLDSPGDYSVDLYVRTLTALLDHLQAPTAHVVGISFGGIPAAALTDQHPDRVASVTLSNAQVDATGWQLSNIDAMNAEIRNMHPETWQALMELRRYGVRSSASEYQDLLGPLIDRMEWFSPDDHPVLHREDAYAFDTATYFAFLGDDPEWTVGGALARHELTRSFTAWRTPALVLSGRHDRITVPRIAHELGASLGVAPVIFEHSGHRPWAEEPGAYFEVLRAFLAGPTPP